ncbi:MAG: citrate transporter, partial [Chitinophagaceae bacterium]
MIFFISLFITCAPAILLGNEVNEDDYNLLETVVSEQEDDEYSSPAIWSVIPFVVLLLMIATGPLFYARFWHNYFPHVASGLGAVTMVYYLFFLNEYHYPLHSAAEYFSFISLLTALFVASGGILIKVNKAGTPFV